VAAVATALWAVLLAVKDRTVVNRPSRYGGEPATGRWLQEKMLDEQNALAIQLFA
jgi:hypothetical protein